MKTKMALGVIFMAVLVSGCVEQQSDVRQVEWARTGIFAKQDGMGCEESFRSNPPDNGQVGTIKADQLISIDRVYNCEETINFCSCGFDATIRG